jgi:hypothetical protein
MTNVSLSRTTRVMLVAVAAFACAVGLRSFTTPAQGGGTQFLAPTADVSALAQGQAYWQRYLSCLTARGAKLSETGDVVSPDARAACAGLYLATFAATHPQAAPRAAWFAAVGAQSTAFWACVSSGGFWVPLDNAPSGAYGREDYASSDFAALSATCAARTGASVPAS